MCTFILAHNHFDFSRADAVLLEKKNIDHVRKFHVQIYIYICLYNNGECKDDVERKDVIIFCYRYVDFSFSLHTYIYIYIYIQIQYIYT